MRRSLLLLIILATCLPIHLQADTIEAPCMYVSISTSLDDNGTSVSSCRVKFDCRKQHDEIDVSVVLPQNSMLTKLQMDGSLSIEEVETGYVKISGSMGEGESAVATIESVRVHGFEDGILKNDGYHLSFSGVTLERLQIQSYIVNSSLARIRYQPADCRLYVLASASGLDNASFAPILSTDSQLRWDLSAEDLKGYGPKDKLTIYYREPIRHQRPYPWPSIFGLMGIGLGLVAIIRHRRWHHHRIGHAVDDWFIEGD